MKSSTTKFVAVWCVLSIAFTAIMLHFVMTDNTKLSQMILINSLFLVGLGIFFAIFSDKITILLGNYEREKEI